MKDIIVIKIGGVASKSLTDESLTQLKTWQKEGKKLLIVHGGGFAISQLMEEHQVPVQKINGLRVTQKSDLDLIKQALWDMVGSHLAKQLAECGLNPIQYREDLAEIVTADFLDKSTYGYVGQASSIETGKLIADLNQGKLPLLASLGVSSEGDWLNINADYLATAVATALSADQLILMTDVKGVLENGQVLENLSIQTIQEKIDAGIITGGMIPKVESAAKTVQAGVGQVMIGDSLTTGTLIFDEKGKL